MHTMKQATTATSSSSSSSSSVSSSGFVVQLREVLPCVIQDSFSDGLIPAAPENPVLHTFLMKIVSTLQHRTTLSPDYVVHEARRHYEVVLTLLVKHGCILPPGCKRSLLLHYVALYVSGVDELECLKCIHTFYTTLATCLEQTVSDSTSRFAVVPSSIQLFLYDVLLKTNKPMDTPVGSVYFLYNASVEDALQFIASRVYLRYALEQNQDTETHISVPSAWETNSLLWPQYLCDLLYPPKEEEEEDQVVVVVPTHENVQKTLKEEMEQFKRTQQQHTLFLEQEKEEAVAALKKEQQFRAHLLEDERAKAARSKQLFQLHIVQLEKDKMKAVEALKQEQMKTFSSSSSSSSSSNPEERDLKKQNANLQEQKQWLEDKLAFLESVQMENTFLKKIQREANASDDHLKTENTRLTEQLNEMKRQQASLSSSSETKSSSSSSTTEEVGSASESSSSSSESEDEEEEEEKEEPKVNKAQIELMKAAKAMDLVMKENRYLKEENRQLVEASRTTLTPDHREQRIQLEEAKSRSNMLEVVQQENRYLKEQLYQMKQQQQAELKAHQEAVTSFQVQQQQQKQQQQKQQQQQQQQQEIASKQRMDIEKQNNNNNNDQDDENDSNSSSSSSIERTQSKEKEYREHMEKEINIIRTKLEAEYQARLEERQEKRKHKKHKKQHEEEEEEEEEDTHEEHKNGNIILDSSSSSSKSTKNTAEKARLTKEKRSEIIAFINQHPDNYKAQKNNGLQLLWLTPLRALAKDIGRAMEEVIEELGLNWKVAIRNGDTSTAERAKQKKQMPEVLIITPESLHLLLAQKNYGEIFQSLKIIAIDEDGKILE